MMDFLTCTNKQFFEEIQEISNINELKDIINSLEQEANRLQKIKDENRELTISEAEVSEEKKLIFIKTQRLHVIQQKINCCKNYLLMLQVKEQLFFDNAKKNSEMPGFLSSESLKNFSWGIFTRKQPEKCFEAIWKYVKNNRRISGKLQVTDCGKFLWENAPNINMDELIAKTQESNISIPAVKEDTGIKTYELTDLLNVLKQEKEKKGDLNLIRVRVDNGSNVEHVIDYMMLMSIDPNLDWKDPELQRFFATTYLSSTFIELITKLEKKEEALYGGRILKNQNGKFEVSFDSKKEIEAVGKANKTFMARRNSVDKSEENLGGMTIMIRDELAGRGRRTKKTRDMFAELSEFDESPKDGR